MRRGGERDFYSERLTAGIIYYPRGTQDASRFHIRTTQRGNSVSSSFGATAGKSPRQVFAVRNFRDDKFSRRDLASGERNLLVTYSRNPGTFTRPHRTGCFATGLIRDIFSA